MEREVTLLKTLDTLEHFNCRGRLLDVQQKQFLTTDYDIVLNNTYGGKNLQVFCGMVYNHHLYYCTDKQFVKSLSEKMKINLNNGFSEQVYEKKKQIDEIQYEVVATNNLMDIYKSQFATDNTIREVRTENGRIVKIIYRNANNKIEKILCANEDKSIMKQILGEEFKNENLTMLGEKEFKEFYPNHKTSAFTKEVFDELKKHTGIVQNFSTPQRSKQFEFDINKCRTACMLENKLGPYEVFGVECQIEPFKGVQPSRRQYLLKLKPGFYYVRLQNIYTREQFFFEGDSWYSGNYLEYAYKEGFNMFSILYQLLAKETLVEDYMKPFAAKMIRKYPDHYKKINNTCVGYRGKTHNKTSRGYVETDFEMASTAFMDNNDEKIGFLTDEHVSNKLWKVMKGRLCCIYEFKITEDEYDEDDNVVAKGIRHYIVESTDYKTLYENDLPIYNKVLENEYVRLYELKKKLGGRTIKIKTDAIVVEGHKRVELSDEIGGYKIKPVYLDAERLNFNKEIKCGEAYELNTAINWKVTMEQEDYSVDVPKDDSWLGTGLAGFGKSHLVKQQPEYDEPTTLLLGFSNVASENLADDTHPAHTINSCFGIDCITGKCSEKKLKNVKSIKTIIITEVFMIPSYIMGHLMKIKNEFPHIKFICEGDPEQTRPVKEEHINWLKTRLLYQLCDGNLMQLQYNKRNDLTPDYDRILDGEPLDESKYGNREPQLVNICRTNAMRVTINHMMMDRTGLFINKHKSNSKSQDVWLTLETPIMCVKNNKKLGLKNGKMYKFSHVNKDKLEIVLNEANDVLKLECEAQFMQYFVVAFAYTNHKVQGITIREHFNIYEWNKMSRREQYTAYSRTSDGNYVQIVSGLGVNRLLWDELQDFFALNYCIYKWAHKECNDFYIGHTNDFEKRKKEHIKSCNVPKDKNHHQRKYVMMRENGGIENWEMVVLEEFYAENREEAEKVEQKWILELQPSLNECASVKIN